MIVTFVTLKLYINELSGEQNVLFMTFINKFPGESLEGCSCHDVPGSSAHPSTQCGWGQRVAKEQSLLRLKLAEKFNEVPPENECVVVTLQ